MPIYEFYCSDCHTIFNFLSRTVNTMKRPSCPQCGKKRLTREVSVFSTVSGQKGEEGDDLPLDEIRMAGAMEALAGEVETMNEEDPRQAAGLMRKFQKMTGLEFGEGMDQAMNRLEAGEDPEQIEAEMGDLMEGEEPFVTPGKGNAGSSRVRVEPRRDSTLHEM